MSHWRTWFARQRIPRKLLLITAASLFSAALIATPPLLAHLWRVQKAVATRDAEVIAHIIAQNSLPALLFRDPAAGHEVLQSLARDPSVRTARIFTRDGQLFAQFAGIYGHTTPSSAGDLAPGSPLPVEHIDVDVPLEAGGERVGRLLLQIDLAKARRDMAAIGLALTVWCLAALLLATAVLVRLQRTITAPLHRLVDLMGHVSADGDYAQRAPIDAEDEIGELERSFNHMIEQIQNRDNALGTELAERKHAESRLEHLAHYDSVTGLPNRHFLNGRALELARLHQQQHQSYALIFIDLDNFKYVNDTFGHAVGDHLLVGVADRVQHELRAADVVARLGGDEFAVLLDNPGSVEQACLIAAKILQALGRPFAIDGHEFFIGASLGAAIVPDHASTLDELLTKADEAMYAAKARGKNNVQIWHEELSLRTAQRFSIESALRRALEQSEFIVHYQAIVDLASGRVAGMEALLRWNNPVLRNVSPAEFIPVAEENGQIVPIGLWVLATACRQAAAWRARYGALFLAVNVSARQVHEAGFPEDVSRIVGEAGFPPEALELELTETVVMDHATGITARLHRLAAEGFNLSIDDFGTGYSSLAYLKHYPIRTLKIDRSFVDGLPADQDEAAIARAIVSLAQALRMDVVAEGIETAAQADFLRGLGCRYGQGYLFSRPLAAAHFEQLLRAGANPAPERPRDAADST